MPQRRGTRLHSSLSIPPTAGPPPSSARSGPAANGRVGRRLSLSRRISEPKVPQCLAPSLTPPPGGSPAAGARGLKSHCELRRRRHSPEEVMGDEQGREILVSN